MWRAAVLGGPSGWRGRPPPHTELIIVKLAVLALDYDGTITDRVGRLDSSVRKAIGDLRASGIAVLIVTGRRLEHLREGAGDLRIVDAVVAENGALIVFPASGRTLFLGHPPPERFLEELRRTGVDFKTGECVVEMHAADAAAALAAIRRLELPLVLEFNLDRLMILPQSVSKGVGLREALTAMRLSMHNTLAIGNAENDHEMLAAAEIGAAVAWGSEALKQMADEVVAGEGAPAVAAYVREVAARPRLVSLSPLRRPMLLGRDEAGNVVTLRVRGRNLLVVGDPRSGKSWIAGLLTEQLIMQRYSVCIIDPEGDYRGLETLPGVILFGGDDPPPRPRELMQALRNADLSTVIDLSKLPFEQKREYVPQLLSMLSTIRRQTGLPHRIVLDEAHYFLDESNVGRLLDAELAGYTLVTYRLSQLPPSVIDDDDVVIVTRHTDRHEVEALRALRPSPDNEIEWAATLGSLRLEDAVLLPGRADGPERPLRFQIAPRITFHVRHRHKYLDVPVSERYAFLFRHDGKVLAIARSFRELSEVLATAQPEVLGHHLRNGDLSRWIRDVFGDRPLAAQVEEVERRYALRPSPDVNDELLRLIRERYSSEEERPGPYSARLHSTYEPS